jgi:hypothetical protein
MDDIRKWSDATFGEDQRTIPILHHLMKEVPEAIEVCETGSHKAQWEFADCLMLLLDASSHYGMDAEDLIRYTRLKLNVNKLRKWGKPDKNGVIEHIVETAGPEKKVYRCVMCSRLFRSEVQSDICPSCYI